MTNKDRYNAYTMQGLCPSCGNNKDDEHVYCSQCRQKERFRYYSSNNPSGEKICVDCGSFISTDNKKVSSRCDKCKREYNNKWARDYYASHPDKREKVKKYGQERYRIKKKEIQFKSYKNRIKRIYGISYEFLIELLDYQNWKCKICGKEIPREETFYIKRTDFAIDHNHITGKVRGVLCSHCNFGLGNFKDDINILENAIQYLVINM